MTDGEVDIVVISQVGKRVLVEVRGGKGGPRRIWVPSDALDVIFTKHGVEDYPAIDEPLAANAS
jgi:hypothetical protein